MRAERTRVDECNGKLNLFKVFWCLKQFIEELSLCVCVCVYINIYMYIAYCIAVPLSRILISYKVGNLHVEKYNQQNILVS